MSVNRLHSPLPLTRHTDIVLGGEHAHYIGKVLRQRPGDSLRVFDGSGGEFDAVIATLSKSEVTIRTGERFEVEVESPLRIHLLQGISRGQRMDFVVQKATELGVQQFTPVLTDFSVVRLVGERAEKKTRHWQKIAVSACEQCGRNCPPAIDKPLTLQKWCQTNSQRGGKRILLTPNADSRLTANTFDSNDVTVLIGPEGGLSDAECEQAAAHGFRRVSLGPRILRTETAALATVVALQVIRGDFA